MIKAVIYRNKANTICAYRIANHGKSIVCAAVSILTMNTVNSIEEFTDEEIVCEYDENGGYLYVEFPDICEGSSNNNVELLLNSMLLGLNSISDEYPGQLEITERNID